MGFFKPKDRKNVEKDIRERYSFSSGSMHSIHGMSNFEVQTQESQVLGFYSNTGQGGTEGGPGTGKALLYTPGQSLEVLGTGLKVRNAGDNTELPAKIIRCKNGDVIVDCYNGNITLRGRNITLDANGGGQDGQIILSANRIINANLLGTLNGYEYISLENLSVTFLRLKFPTSALKDPPKTSFNGSTSF